jgi:hypothetical protein
MIEYNHKSEASFDGIPPRTARIGDVLISLDQPQQDVDAAIAAAVALLPVEYAPRIILAADFIARFSPQEVGVLMGEPVLMTACLAAVAQGEVDLNSPRMTELLNYAVTLGLLPAERAMQIQI